MAQRIGQTSFGVRALVLLAAAAVAVWCAIGVRDAKLQTEAIGAVIDRPARALVLLDDAATLNASTQPDLLRAGAYWAQGNRRRAIATLGQVVREHPDHISAWALLARYLEQSGDGSAAKHAQERARRLNGAIPAP